MYGRRHCQKRSYYGHHNPQHQPERASARAHEEGRRRLTRSKRMTTSETPTTSRDLNWIKQALQSAVEVECSTLPLYLSALFSLEVQNYTTYNVIRSVAMEEM